MQDNFKISWKILFLVTFCVMTGAFIRLMFVQKELTELKSIPPVQCPVVENKPSAACGVDLAETPDALPGEKTAEVNSQAPNDMTGKVETKGGYFSFSVPVTASFYNTFEDSKVISELAVKTGNKRLGELLSAHVSRNLVFLLDMRKDVYPGDKISVVFKTVTDEERRTRPDNPDEIEIIAMKYKSVRLAKDFSFYSFKPTGRTFSAFYDASGQSVEKHLKNSPLKEYIQITSLLKDRSPKHDGIDFKTPVGTPVYAPYSGKVIRTNWKTRFNGTSMSAELNTNPRTYMVMLHLDKLYVKDGQSFKAGDHIADSGNSGRSYAPHLHYQLQKEPGKTRAIIDPLKYHETFRLEIKDSDKPAFEARKKELDSLMK
ncbi:MAG TPA: M23 family metallopeptidase [bacterium]|nr:M23 family metallopeptidase [bacterium]HPS31397.1 M23 family metallopeptidase [bacterium]